MNLARFNTLPPDEAEKALRQCCGAERWVKAMLARRPFVSWDQLTQSASAVWGEMNETDWRQAFSHHPRLGDLDSLRQKFASTAAWAAQEQRGTTEATEETLKALQAGNVAYERRFGFIFILCATGKSAAEMLAALTARLSNDTATELRTAAAEQLKITHLRLEKLP